jgi:hypothetical protein
MLRSTGPGKVRDIPVKGIDDPETTIKASLFNFDIDGDALKPPHVAWLKEHIVPQLGDASVTINLTGEASLTGSDAHNDQLAQKRVSNVEAFLRKSPPVLATINSLNAGDSDAVGAGENPSTEDERFRAVTVTVRQSAHRLVPATFDFEGNFMGFDDETAAPPWLMLPAGASSRLMRINNGEGLRLISSNSGVVRVRSPFGFLDKPVEVSQQSQIFRVLPGITADASILAVDRAGRTHARLDVSVLRERIVTCAFHFVRNARYGSTRQASDVPDFLEALNNIWGSQANIRFVNTGGVRELPMTDDLGDTIDNRAKFDAVARHRVSGVQFNVFFVGDVQDEDGTNPTGLTHIGPPGDCLFDDPPASGDDPRKAVLAHEAGHCLTLDHNTPTVTTAQMLMHDSTEDGVAASPFLSKAQVLQARRAVFG